MPLPPLGITIVTAQSSAQRAGDAVDHHLRPQHDLLAQPANHGEVQIAQDLFPLLLLDDRCGIVVLGRAVRLADQSLFRPQAVGVETPTGVRTGA